MTIFKQANETLFTLKPLARATIVHAILLAALGVSVPLVAVAQVGPVNTAAVNAKQHTYIIAAQQLENALIQLGRQSGLAVSVESALVTDKQASKVQGTMTVAQFIQKHCLSKLRARQSCQLRGVCNLGFTRPTDWYVSWGGTNTDPHRREDLTAVEEQHGYNRVIDFFSRFGAL